jgi:heme-degrading monooxygenase HmoA
MNDRAYLAIWEFEVNADFRSQFEKTYGSEGAWARLFRQSPEYRGTKLIRDLTRPGRYLTLDYWTSRDAFQRFKQAYAAEYANLDQQCERLTDHEAMVGEFEQFPAAPDS